MKSRQKASSSKTDVSPQLSLLALVEGGGAAEAASVLEHLSPSVASQVRRSFGMMGIAEEVIATRWPGRRNEPRIAFMLALPTHPVRISDMLYRAHVEELLGRLPDGRDVHPASGGIWKGLTFLTRAEVLGLLVESSLRHPLAHHEGLVYEALFRELFPKAVLNVEEVVHGARTQEEVRRSIDEWLARKSPERTEQVAKLRREAGEEPAEL